MISVVSVIISEFSFLSVTSAIIYLWIAVWISFCVIFLWIVICIIVDCWLNCQSVKSFYCFFQNVRRNFPLVCHICNFSLRIGRDGGLMTEIIHSHIIGITFGVTFFLFRFCHEFTDCLSKFLIGKWFIVKIILIN